jgi:hypothetical protein
MKGILYVAYEKRMLLVPFTFYRVVVLFISVFVSVVATADQRATVMFHKAVDLLQCCSC